MEEFIAIEPDNNVPKMDGTSAVFRTSSPQFTAEHTIKALNSSKHRRNGFRSVFILYTERNLWYGVTKQQTKEIFNEHESHAADAAEK